MRPGHDVLPRLVDPSWTPSPRARSATVVTGDRQPGKPHPEPYLKAAAELGLAAVDCLAMEDSNTGARSAEAAGCRVLCVPNHVPVLGGERRIFRDTLADLRARDLRFL